MDSHFGIPKSRNQAHAYRSLKSMKMTRRSWAAIIKRVEEAQRNAFGQYEQGKHLAEKCMGEGGVGLALAGPSTSTKRSRYHYLVNIGVVLDENGQCRTHSTTGT